MNIRKLSRIDSLMEKRLGAAAWASIIVEHNGRRVYENNFAMDRKDSIYRLMSMTKPVTALAAMILYERGELDLLAPVADFLPAFADCKVASPEGVRPVASPILIRNLLNMTSGIVLPGDYGEAGQSMTRCHREVRIQKRSGILKNDIDVVSKFAESFLMFDPGTDVHYGLSADVLGAVIEAITGQSLSQFMGDEIFANLNMTDTGFYIRGDQAYRQAVMMGKPGNGGKVTRADTRTLERYGMEDPVSPPWYESGGIGLYSTMEDYAHFCQMLLNRGAFHGKELIGRRTHAFMTGNQLGSELLERYGKAGYGFGSYFNILLDPAAASSSASVGAYECSGEAGTYFLVDPTEDLVIIYMQQQDGGADEGLIRALKQIVYGTL
ncbi:serine hydrolase domain-containing protein [Butyrivibrio sp. MC2013]|uniref:serine hydrolase domain-containing protein n=1 Tax=Butyrivibrio sp. MC2013 TaxID=1280686 RepID=UPI00041F5A31|nr:serine hydrolase [Butyrivibrio sp. MC2013]